MVEGVLLEWHAFQFTHDVFALMRNFNRGIWKSMLNSYNFYHNLYVRNYLNYRKFRCLGKTNLKSSSTQFRF